MASIPHEITRPDIHFTPPSGWMNDPNGLVYANGEYHLFYQHNPGSIDWGDIHWGHAVSRDFLHWKHLPDAIAPDAIGTIWSGSAVVDAQNTSGLLPGGGIVAAFSYSNQSQAIAYSGDNGRTWTKYAGNPVLPNDGSKDFRDPKVFWYAPRSYWVMSVAVGTSIRFYTSPNLCEWTFASAFVAPREGDIVWECPDLLSFTLADGTTKWVLYFSEPEGGAPADGSGTCYYVGDFDGTTFTADDAKRLWLDNGKDNYAGTTWSNLPDGRTVFIGWMTNQRYSGRIPATVWRGTMTLPREFSLRETATGWRIVQQPLRELQQLRGESRQFADVRVTDNQPLDLGSIGTAVEVVIQLETGTAAECGLHISNGQEHITIDINRLQQTISVDRSSTAGFDHVDYLQRHTASLTTLDPITLRVFIDSTSVEVFADDGEIVFTELIFMNTDHRQLECFASGGEIHVKHLELYALSSINQVV